MTSSVNVQTMIWSRDCSLYILFAIYILFLNTAKPFNLAAFKLHELEPDIIVAHFPPGSTSEVSEFILYAPFNFAFLFTAQKLQNKGHVNIKDLMVY